MKTILALLIITLASGSVFGGGKSRTGRPVKAPSKVQRLRVATDESVDNGRLLLDLIRQVERQKVEMKDKKARVEDALHATRAAVEEGIIPGGGVSFIRSISSLDDVEIANEDQGIGVNILRRALEEPLRQIAENAGVEGSIVAQKVKEGKGDFGFNAQTEEYGNLVEQGVIDPTKVARTALENAASVAGLLLTTEAVVVDKPDKDSPGMPGGAPGMGGMDF